MIKEEERINAHVFKCYHDEICYIDNCKCACHKKPILIDEKEVDEDGK